MQTNDVLQRYEEELITAPKKQYLRISEAAKILNVSTKTLRRWETAGKLRCVRTKGNQRLFPVTEILRMQLLSPKGKQQANNEVIAETKVEHQSSARHELKAVKVQLKTLNILLKDVITPQNAIITVKELVTMIQELIDKQQVLKPVKNSCDALQAMLLALKLEICDSLLQDEITQTVEGVLPTTKSHTPATTFTIARETAGRVFQILTKASKDSRLATKEQTRAKQILKQVLKPYQLLTSNLVKYSEGSVEHDVSRLLLTRHPTDYNLRRNTWSVRSLTKVCQEVLNTKSASKSQVGRFYKKLGWHRPVQHKLISPDQEFGTKMKAIAKTMAQMTENDVILYGDEFKFTTTKVQEHIMPKYAPKGLQFRIKEGTGNYFAPTQELKITGLYNPCTRELETTELLKTCFDQYFPALVSLLKRFFQHVKGQISIILDNAANHQSKKLQTMLQKIFGKRIQVLFLPTYSPNRNPIERVWKQLLGAVTRNCSTKEELQKAFDTALKEQQCYRDKHSHLTLKLHCPICKETFVFSGTKNPHTIEHVEQHLCFSIPGLNPYAIQILTHSLEVNY